MSRCWFGRKRVVIICLSLVFHRNCFIMAKNCKMRNVFYNDKNMKPILLALLAIDLN